MSGGTFDYRQSHIEYIADAIEEELFKENDFKKETKKELIKGVELLRKAYIYAQRIDYLMEGDDTEESFLERLRIELQANEK